MIQVKWGDVLASIKIVDVTPNEIGFIISVEFDYTLLVGTTPQTFSVNVSKPEYLFWKESNPSGTVDDYIISLVRPHYERLLAQKTLATQLGLINKTLTW